MNPKLPTQFGTPVNVGYSSDMQVNILRSQSSAGWSRQRRLWLHNPTVFKLTYKLSIELAGLMVSWLRANTSLINLKLLHANNVEANCEFESLDVQRKTEINVERIPFVNQVYVKFDVELKSQVNYGNSSLAARGPQQVEYPKNLPLPLSSGFDEVHKESGLTEYQMQFKMDTRTLARFLAFAGAKGLRWFKIHWPVTNVGCGDEYIRFISDPSMQLDGPNQWTVSMTAESMPAFLKTEPGAPTPPPTPGTRTYEQPSETYDSNKPYEG
jgi:hypothetical protein